MKDRGENFVAYTSATHPHLICEGMLVSCCGEYYRLTNAFGKGRRVLNRETGELSQWIRPVPEPFIFCMEDPETKGLADGRLSR
jgi:hypothetical protein